MGKFGYESRLGLIFLFDTFKCILFIYYFYTIKYKSISISEVLSLCFNKLTFNCLKQQPTLNIVRQSQGPVSPTVVFFQCHVISKLVESLV